MARILRLTAALLLAASAVATPFSLTAVARPTELSDIDAEFTSEFNSSADCPTMIRISNAAEDLQVKNMVTVKSADIVENDRQCPAGQPSITLLNEQNFLTQNRRILTSLKLNAAIDALGKNRNARDVLAENRSRQTGMYTGFSNGTRECGVNKYDPSTIYFFVKEEFPVVLTTKDASGKEQVITIPPNKRGLVIVDGNDRICVLADASTGDSAPVDVNNESASGGTGSTTLPVNSPSNAANGTGELASPSDAPNGEENLSADSTTEPSGRSVCFPGSGSVELVSGKFVTMADLRIGDRVRTGPDSFSDIFLFTHRDANVHEQFVRLVTAAGPAVTLTKSHYLYANGALVAAGSVRNGDVLSLADGSSSTVSTVENVSADGLYNPQTVDGNIVVDGVVSSAYTTAVHPRVAHGALLAPVRFFYERSRMSIAVLDALAGFISGSADALARIVPAGPGMMA